eukprot:763984-Hanusia_phi.AAC.3
MKATPSGGSGGGLKGFMHALETIRNVSGISVIEEGDTASLKDDLPSPWVPNVEGKSGKVIFAQGWLWKQDSDWTRRCERSEKWEEGSGREL